MDDLTWVGLLAASPFLVFPSIETTPALLVVPWVVWSQQRALRSTPLNGSIAVLALMTLVSLYATYDLVVSLPKISGLLLGLAVYYVTARWASRQGVEWWPYLFYGLLGLGVTAAGLVGTRWSDKLAWLRSIQAVLPERLIQLPGAPQGIQPNELGGALLWVTPFLVMCLAGLVVNRQVLLSHVGRAALGGLTLLTALAAALSFGAIILTQSRSSYAGLAAVFPFLTHPVLPRRLRPVVWLSAIGLAVGIMALVSRAPSSLPLPAEIETAIEAVPASMEGRLEIWSRAIYGIQDFPFTGMGLNTFRRVVHVLYPLFLISPETDIGHAHNEFLQAALDLGIPGLIAFIAMQLTALWMVKEVWRAKLPQVSSMHRLIILGLGAGLLAHLVYGLTDAVALGAKPGILFWMLLGLITGLYLRTGAPHSRRGPDTANLTAGPRPKG